MESEVKYGMVTQPLISSWKESLSIVGHAVCVHHQCRLCFLSLAGKHKYDEIKYDIQDIYVCRNGEPP